MAGASSIAHPAVRRVTFTCGSRAGSDDGLHRARLANDGLHGAANLPCWQEPEREAITEVLDVTTLFGNRGPGPCLAWWVMPA